MEKFHRTSNQKKIHKKDNYHQHRKNNNMIDYELVFKKLNIEINWSNN